MLKRVKFIVADTSAFLKNSPIYEYADNVFTVEGVVKEIKDSATRQRLLCLPYELKIKEPSQEIFKYVLEFSKKTGDYASLSVTDIKVIALTYQLEKEHVGTDHLNSEPMTKVTGHSLSSNQQLSGFYYPEEQPEKEPSDITTSCYDKVDSEYDSTKNLLTQLANGEETSTKKVSRLQKEHNGVKKCSDGYVTYESSTEDTDFGDGTIEKDSDEECWITPGNISEVQNKMRSMYVNETDSVIVACLTTDFAVQNMLLQIGLHVVSLDGMMIKQIKEFILRCYACFKLISDTTKIFCSNCGNRTLKRVAVTYNENGSRNIHINFRKPINIRGTKYSLPMPRGGKHSQDPILCEDQRVPHNRPAKMALKKIDPMNPDYEALSSPFAVNDVYSRASSLGVRTTKGRNCHKNLMNGLNIGNKKRK